MRNVENDLIEQRLHGEPGTGEEELLVRLHVNVDARIHRWPSGIESEGRCCAQGKRRRYMADFMKQHARRKAAGECPPVTSSALRAGGQSRDQETRRHDGDSGSDK